MSPKSGPKRLRELLKEPGIIRSLGAHDVFTALIVEQVGFETVFIGGFGTSASMLGLPDLNFLTMSEMADAVRRTAARVCIPVIADGDTGYGDLHNVQRTVEAFEAAGASGILLEDQVMPKRCGHFANKRVIPSEEMVLKIKAAVKTKSDPDLRHFRSHRRAPDERAGRRHRSGQSMLRQWRRHRFHRSAGIACRTGGDPEAGEASAVRQHAYRRGDADSLGKGAGATRLQDRGLPHRIADGLRPGHARLVRRVEEHRSRR